MSTQQRDHGWECIKRVYQALAKQEVVVGILSAQGSQATESGATLAEAAIYNEFGTDHIPERPAHRQTFESNRQALRVQLAGSVRMVSQGKMTVDQALNRAGIWYTGQLRKAIITFDDPPNAPSTVAKKGANNPLVDTGRTVNSIQHEIRRKNGR